MRRTLPTMLFLAFIIFLTKEIHAQDSNILKVTITEKQNLDRSLEYIELECQISFEGSINRQIQVVAENIQNNERIPCQVSSIKQIDSSLTGIARIVFPVSIPALSTKEYKLVLLDEVDFPDGIMMQGDGLDLIIENEFYKVDLTKNTEVEPQSHDSGQIRELLIKLGFNQPVTNVEDRVHWAPNFDRPEIEWYTTIAHWNFPETYLVEDGSYSIRTIRQDFAPEHPEILLTAVYDFYAGLPYFRFYSAVEIKQDVWLQLLRNDEMTMDSMFTHIAFQRPNGDIVDLPFSEIEAVIDKQPIENRAPWLCFYNKDKGFAFGSIRVLYDNTNTFGDPSILYKPHTQIGKWNSIRYWNRRLIHDKLTYVPKGNSYREENAYLVFKTDNKNHLQDIQYWAERLRHPLKVDIEYLK